MKERMIKNRKKPAVLPKTLYAFKDGSVYTRLSFPFMGFGQMARGQIVKGAAYMLIELAFVLYMFLFGGRYIGHLFSGNLGTKLTGEHWNEELQIFEKVTDTSKVATYKGEE